MGKGGKRKGKSLESSADERKGGNGGKKSSYSPPGGLAFPVGYSLSDETFQILAISDDLTLTYGKKETKRLNDRAEAGFSPEQVSSRIISGPVLEKDGVGIGFDLRNAYNLGCCLGRSAWNGRSYAHQLSSEFSSPEISTVDKFLGCNFVSDWENAKSLLKAYDKSTRLSFLVHKIGGTITIDHLDLASALFLFPNYLELPPGFLQFLRDFFKDFSLKEISGKSSEEILTKEGYHKLLHACMKTPMVLEEKSCSSSNFLRNMTFQLGSNKFLVGCNTPVYYDSGTDDGSSCTVRLSEEYHLSSLESFDLWLDNCLHSISKSVVFTHKSWKITKVSNSTTKTLAAACNPPHSLEIAEKLLTFLNTKVTSGSTYWLHRQPGQGEICLFNLSQISKTKKNFPGPSIFEHWTKLEPYKDYFEHFRLIDYSDWLAENIHKQICNQYKHLHNTHLTPELLPSKPNILLHGHIRSPPCSQTQISHRDQISLQNLPEVLSAVKVTYDRLAELSLPGVEPSNQHLVKSYFLCLRDTCNFLCSHRQLKGGADWTPELLQFLVDFTSWLLSCHRTINLSATSSQYPVWSYIFLVMSLNYGDLFNELANLYQDNPEQLKDCLEKAALSYQGSLTWIDSVKATFPLTVPAPYAPPTVHGKQHWQAFVDKICPKLGCTFLSLALYSIKYPPNGGEDEEGDLLCTKKKMEAVQTRVLLAQKVCQRLRNCKGVRELLKKLEAVRLTLKSGLEALGPGWKGILEGQFPALINDMIIFLRNMPLKN